MHKDTRVAIIGAGLSGATLACLLGRAGFDVAVYEQAPAFDRIGAGIHLSPNLIKIARRVGIEDALIEGGIVVDTFYSRDWQSGTTLFELPLGAASAVRYGAPYLTAHRGDLHKHLVEAVPPGLIRFGKKLAAIERGGARPRLVFEDGTREEADIVVGADGVKSKVREVLAGPSREMYIGSVAHRLMVPVERLKGPRPAACTKWWGQGRHILIYDITRARDEVYVVSSCPEPGLADLRTSIPCEPGEVLQAFSAFHPEVRAVIEAAPSATKWPIFDVDNMAHWSEGRLVLLGDSCHATRPYMAMGAAMAMEDAAVLARCLIGIGDADPAPAFAAYEHLRIPRTKRVQDVSNQNTFLKLPTDPSWAFCYDAFDEDLRLAA